MLLCTFAEVNQRGDLSGMDGNEILEGHLLIYYQHGIESKLLTLGIQINWMSTYNHSCLKHSHTCVDSIKLLGRQNHLETLLQN